MSTNLQQTDGTQTSEKKVATHALIKTENHWKEVWLHEIRSQSIKSFKTKG